MKQIWKKKKEETFENIVKRGFSKINKEYNANNYVFFYKGIKLDLNKKVEDIVDEEDIKNRIIKIDAKECIQVYFYFKNKTKEMICYKKEYIKDICEKYSSYNKLNIDNLIFKIRNSEIYLKIVKTIGELYIESLNNCNDTFINLPIKNEKAEIEIEVNEISCCKKYKKCLIIFGIILSVIIMAGAIILGFFLGYTRTSN